jgi:hypothetical protein
MVHKLTEAKVKYFIKDEKKATKEYRKYGLTNLSNDEAGHRGYLEGLLKASKKLKKMYKK